jgi:glycosyltransferase involved in cell wall biosynthesis
VLEHTAQRASSLGRVDYARVQEIRRAPAPAGSMRGRSVCLYTPSVDPSGMGAHMLDLAECYLAAGAEVSVMCWPTTPGTRVLTKAAALGAVPFATPHPRDPVFGAHIREFLRSHPAQVFHIHVGHGRENFDGARAARQVGVPVVIQTQHLPWLLAAPRKSKRFFVGIKPVDRLICVSEAQRSTYERIGVPAELLRTVPNGVRPRGPGPGRREARRTLGLAEDRLVVLNVGRLTVMKGQRYLVEAVPRLAERFPGLAVVILGQGHLHEQLEAQAAALGVSEHVHLAGHRTDARLLLDAADVFVLPSRHEGMPLAVLEAMDARLPVVGTRVIGTDEVVQDGETGRLVRPGDPDALACALADLLADPELRRRYADAGRRRYLERFTAQRMADETAGVYEEVLGTREATGCRAAETSR